MGNRAIAFFAPTADIRACRRPEAHHADWETELSLDPSPWSITLQKAGFSR
jgi:hypothetical protein